MLPTRYDEMRESENLWQRFLDGEVDALGSLMKVHYKDLFYYGCKFSRDQAFVEDSIQDMFLKLWEKRKGIASHIPAKAYLMATLRRAMHREARLHDRWIDQPLDTIDERFAMSFSVEEHFIEEESTQNILLKIKLEVEKLPSRQKEVIYLKFFQELDRHQIAEIMGISPQTVSNQLQIAIGHLKKHFKTEYLVLFLLHFLG